MGKSVRGPDGKKIKKDKTAAAPAAAPSLSTFLLAQVDAKDSALDDIFANSQGPSIAFLPPVEKKVKKEKKRKAESPAPVAEEEEAPEAEEDDEVEVDNDAELSEADSNESLDLPEDSDDDDGVEEAYAAKQVAARLKAMAQGTKVLKRKAEDDVSDASEGEGEDESAGESEDEQELDIDNLLHESLLPKAIYKEVPATAKDIKKAKVEKARAASTETPEERDARTIFLGNVPVDCSTSRPMKKALIRHILQSPSLLALLPPNCPPLKADSIRFRSLAFASTVFGRKAVVDPNADPSEPPVEPGGRGRKRAKNWRDTEAEGADERGVKGGFRGRKEDADAPVAEKANKRQPLTDGQKRRVAFIRGEINEGKKVCNAYLVLAPLPASFATFAMADVLAAVVLDANGSTFEGMTLRADAVRPRSSASTVAAAKLASKPSKADSLAPPNTGPSYTVPPAEARRTLFMGGLDFAESEENVRAATEAILVKERGPSGEKGWVEGVRIVRDASTGLGKGFGYVLMRDAECVDELLALPFGQPLKVSKRKPRLERCKTGVAAARAKAASAARDVKAKAASAPGGGKPNSGITGAVPRDPKPRLPRASTSESAHQAKIAEALAKLPVGERKAIKAVDPDRLMRRAQKKKNKVLGERFERKQANGDKAAGILGRPSRGMERARKEKKRVAAGNKTGKRAKI
ncbi:hypothetical protein RQP46_001220 [Phenoliferia psychrophenolica]